MLSLLAFLLECHTGTKISLLFFPGEPPPCAGLGCLYSSPGPLEVTYPRVGSILSPVFAPVAYVIQEVLFDQVSEAFLLIALLFTRETLCDGCATEELKDVVVEVTPVLIFHPRGFKLSRN